MKLNRIHCKNFFVHRDTVLNFSDDNEPVLLIGSNGSGKSSSASEALTYVLFGETRLTNLDDAIRTGQDQMTVTVELELNGQILQITRSKKRGKSQKLQLKIDDEDVSELLSETQKHIEKLIPLSYNAFRSSIILRQEDSDWFLNAKPDERKKIIAEILSLDEYERLEKLAREQRAEMKTLIKVEQNILNNLSEVDIDILQNQYDEIVARLQKFESRIKKAQAELDFAVNFNAENRRHLEEHNKKIANNKKIDETIARYETHKRYKHEELGSLLLLEQPIVNLDKNNVLEAHSAVKSLNESYEHINDLYLQLIENTQQQISSEFLVPARDTYKQLEQKITTLTETLSEVNAQGTICHACNRPFDDAAHRITYIDKLNQELKETNKDCDEARVNFVKIQRQYNEVKQGKFPEALSLQKNINEIKNHLQTAIKLAEKASLQFETDSARVHQYEVTIANRKTLTETIATLNETIMDLGQQKEFIEPYIMPEPLDESSFQTKLQTLRDNEKFGLKKQFELGQQIKDGEKSNQQRIDLLQSINAKNKRLGLLDKLCVAFSRSGVPAAIISTILPEIQDIANKYLAKISENSLEIHFETTETLKNGESRDTLEIEVFDGVSWRRLDTFSGGERFRVSLSIRLALSRILANKADVELKTIILDEPATSLDENGKELFVQTVKSLTAYFSRIIIMTHLDLSEEFNNVIFINERKK